MFVVCQGLQGNEPVGLEKSIDQRIVTVVVEIGSHLVYFVSVGCRFEILENNKQTRESTALSVAYNVERWRRGWEGIVGRRRRVATWTYPYNVCLVQQDLL